MVGSAVDREEALVRAAETDLDVVVVGAGITGAGVALDAVQRGYTVVLVDRSDVAAGTSSRSSKLVHGGLRYLRDGDVAMVRESVRERDRTRRMAPHLVRPLPFAVATPTVGDRAVLKAGLTLYDGLAVGRRVAAHGRLSAPALRVAAPTLRRTAGGGYRYWDARTDDARLTLAIVQAARERGVLVGTHVEVDEVLAGPGGRAAGVAVTDRSTGASTTWRARWVVAAGGAWAGALRGLAPPGAWRPQVRPARGAHLVFDRDSLPVTSAVVFPSAAGDGRRLFAVPWGGQVYVGTNDVPATTAEATVTEADVAYLLNAVTEAFADPPGREHVVGAWAGVRPLVDGAARSGATADLSRRHLVVEDPPGAVHVTGGKLTTWRAMAQDVVDHLVDRDDRRVRCATVGTPLGAVGPRRVGDARVRAIGAARGIDPVVCSALYHRHGDAAPAVLVACTRVPDGLEPIVEGLPYVRGELTWAVRHELARTVTDLLSRRTRIALRDRSAGQWAAVELALDALDAELGGIDQAGQRDRYERHVRRLRGCLAP